MSQFYDGSEVPNVLCNLIDMFGEDRTSYLYHARANDVEMWRQQRAAGIKPRKSKKIPPPETFEVGLDTEILMAIFALLQQQIHVTATHGSKAAKKKPKITYWPRPRTAVEDARRQDAIDAWRNTEALLVYEDDA